MDPLGVIGWIVAGVLVLGIRAQRLGLQKQAQEALSTAATDPLTGVANRRGFDEALETELGRARLSQEPLSLVLADVRGFKAINDRFGHSSGDDCLRQVAAALCDGMRGADRCYRWGGDEFAVILPSTGHARAADIAARLARRVRASCRTADAEPLRLAAGSAELTSTMSGAELLEAADLALIDAKAGSAAAHEYR